MYITAWSPGRVTPGKQPGRAGHLHLLWGPAETGDVGRRLGHGDPGFPQEDNVQAGGRLGGFAQPRRAMAVLGARGSQSGPHMSSISVTWKLVQKQTLGLTRD